MTNKKLKIDNSNYEIYKSKNKVLTLSNLANLVDTLKFKNIDYFEYLNDLSEIKELLNDNYIILAIKYNIGGISKIKQITEVKKDYYICHDMTN